MVSPNYMVKVTLSTSSQTSVRPLQLRDVYVNKYGTTVNIVGVASVKKSTVVTTPVLQT